MEIPEIDHIHEHLRAIDAHCRAARQVINQAPDIAPADPYAVAEALLRIHDRLAASLDRSMFRSPALRILLDLFVATALKKSIAVSSLCIAAGVPASTGARWINELVSTGHLETKPHPTDQRMTHVFLTAETALKLRQALERMSL